MLEASNVQSSEPWRSEKREIENIY